MTLQTKVLAKLKKKNMTAQTVSQPASKKVPRKEKLFLFLSSRLLQNGACKSICMDYNKDGFCIVAKKESTTHSENNKSESREDRKRTRETLYHVVVRHRQKIFCILMRRQESLMTGAGGCCENELANLLVDKNEN